jgi:hypothetical protein
MTSGVGWKAGEQLQCQSVLKPLEDAPTPIHHIRLRLARPLARTLLSLFARAERACKIGTTGPRGILVTQPRGPTIRCQSGRTERLPKNLCGCGATLVCPGVFSVGLSSGLGSSDRATEVPHVPMDSRLSLR